MICRIAWSRPLAVVVATVVGSNLAVIGNGAIAATPLNQATVQKLKNQVQLVLKSQSPRAAKVRDQMTPGDAVKTAKAAMVELKFNDRSLARIGEQAFFRFAPNTRNFTLNNGTALFLIPPGQGTTRVTTPNAIAGIRGSALFARYIPETKTTIIGALTDSGITISNGKEPPQALQAGQLAVVVKDQLVGVYRFDLQRFYETSDLVKDLQLQSTQSLTTETDPAIAAVRQETVDAIAQQSTLVGGLIPTVQDTAFLKRPEAETGGPEPDGSIPIGGSRFDHLGMGANARNQAPASILNRGGNFGAGPDVAAPISNLPAIYAPTFSTPVSPVSQPTIGTITPGAPGNSGNNPFGGPPGLNGGAPGNSGNNPVGGPPGLNGGAPGNSGNNPVGGPPGVSGLAPGNSGSNPFGGPPGLNGNAPGNSGNNPFGGPPGLNGGAPGNSGNGNGNGPGNRLR